MPWLNFDYRLWPSRESGQKITAGHPVRHCCQLCHIKEPGVQTPISHQLREGLNPSLRDENGDICLITGRTHPIVCTTRTLQLYHIKPDERELQLRLSVQCP